ncbi:hypothetical protein C8F04DRAFT_1187338 [Mycena alexandri]|uniref:Uncharacterized protein n=1 Tax=Mycena alexandri TaxID=1745969 RepID=A0AAD6WZ15_9AGAR|nr:hypothetical protein C8F04DRAFT_1187338 [Mycena alexandri]
MAFRTSDLLNPAPWSVERSRTPRSLLLADPIESVVAGSTRLSSHVRNSPHLGSFIRCLIIGIRLEILEQNGRTKARERHRCSGTTALTILAEFTTFPAISSIFLKFLTFAGPHDFERIVRGFGSSVEALTLQLSELLNAPLCPLDLQNLVDVTFTGFMSTALLKTSHSTISRLAFTQEDFLGGLDFAFPLPVLTQVSFKAVRAQAFGAVVERLSQSPALPLLRKIFRTVTGFDAPSWPQHADRHLRNFDRALNALQLPTLQRVQFSLADTKGKSAENLWFSGPSVASKRELVEGFLPALKARGVLVPAASPCRWVASNLLNTQPKFELYFSKSKDPNEGSAFAAKNPNLLGYEKPPTKANADEFP